MLNSNAQPFQPKPFQPMNVRVKDAVLNGHAPLYEPVNRSGRGAMLNVQAAPPQPVYSDEHSLFLTFSNGFPLTESQIFDFFYWWQGPNVEQVIIPRPRGGGPALHGKVVFKNTIIPNLVMGNREKVCFAIAGLPVYVKRFVRKQRKKATTAGTSLRDGVNQ